MRLFSRLWRKPEPAALPVPINTPQTTLARMHADHAARDRWAASPVSRSGGYVIMQSHPSDEMPWPPPISEYTPPADCAPSYDSGSSSGSDSGSSDCGGGSSE